MLALMEKGVAFNSHYLDLLNFDQHKPDYLAINPQGTIPAMLHGERVLTESTAIMEYVDEAFPGPRLMPERSARPLARALVDEVHGPVAGPELFHDRLERVRRSRGALQGPGGTQGGHRAHSAAGAPRRLAQGDLRAVRCRGNAGVSAPCGARHPHARAGSSRNGRGSPAISTVWPTSTVSILRLRCRCRSRRCPTTSSRPNILRWLRTIYARPATKACWAMGRTNLAKRVDDPRAAAHRPGAAGMSMTVYHGEPNGPSLTVLATLFAKQVPAQLVHIDLAGGAAPRPRVRAGAAGGDEHRGRRTGAGGR